MYTWTPKLDKSAPASSVVMPTSHALMHENPLVETALKEDLRSDLLEDVQKADHHLWDAFETGERSVAV
jgi:hypothetical protein